MDIQISYFFSTSQNVQILSAMGNTFGNIVFKPIYIQTYLESFYTVSRAAWITNAGIRVPQKAPVTSKTVLKMKPSQYNYVLKFSF